MKKNVLYILAAACMLAPACQREEEFLPEAGVLTARIAEEEPSTRTSYDSYEGKFLWNEGDEIAVHLSDGTAAGRYESIKVTPDSPAETGRLPISTTSTMARDFFAVYPAYAAVASDYGNPTLKVSLPSSYDISDIVAGTSALKSADFSPVPMVAVNDPASSELDFYHVGGLLRITCINVPAGTKSIAVTMDKGITGTFAVDVSDPTKPNISATEATASNGTVTFTVSSSGLSAEANIVLNVPVPCGVYSHVNIKAFAADSTPTLEKNYDITLDFARHHGKKLAFGLVDFVLAHTGTTETLADGTVVQEVVRDEDTSGATTTAPFDSYRTTDGGTTKEDVGVTYKYAEADADGLPVRTGGEIAWSSTRPSELSSVTSDGSVNKDFSANVTEYSSGIVKEVKSEFLKHAENLKSRTEVGSSASPYDLSMYDIHGVSRGGQPVTANSYVVDRAGWYMFPLVYGNAIDYTKSGKTLYNRGVNAYAYKDKANPSTNANNEWHNFQNYSGGLISTPYVLDDCGLTSSDVEAVVVWQDVEGPAYSFIKSVAVSDVESSGVFYDPTESSYKKSVPYIKFQVPKGEEIDPDETKYPLQRVTGIRQGNAVIAIRKKSDKTILWSWHIWITDGFDTDGDSKGNGLASIPVTNYQNVTLDMMPVNMGWCDTKTITDYKDRVWYVRVSQQTSGSAEPIVFRVVQRKAPLEIGSSGTYYQWGRKDPFLPSTGTKDCLNKAAYSPAVYTLGSTSAVSYNASPAANASTAIQNPFTHYHDSSTYGWMSSVYPYNLWNMANGTSTGDVAVSKTVYDPCPPGYCVPRRYAFTGFTATGANTSTASQFNVEDRDGDEAISSADFENEKGWYFYTNSSKTRTIFFPAAGYRRYSGSSLRSVGDIGSYWFAAPVISSSNGYSSYFSSSSVYPNNDLNDRSDGFAVRPVEE